MWVYYYTYGGCLESSRFRGGGGEGRGGEGRVDNVLGF